MVNPLKKLDDKLIELGGKLASPPSSIDELYSLLDLTDGFLSRVEQSPSPSMWKALQPLMKALTVKEFLRHPDMDVRVAVASCFSEITRITAPDAPYDDDIMKEIFQLIVGAFEGLGNRSSRSFKKRVSILETVAKVRSCVVMLDLECDALILDMFHHFLGTISIDHSENVLPSMETIMTLVIEESEYISSELLSSLLNTLKEDKEDVQPISQRLAEKVMGNCANKIRSCLLEMVQSTRALLSEFNEVVASICGEDHKETNASGEALEDDSKLSERKVSDELPRDSVKLEQKVGSPEKVGTSADIPPMAAMSNGTVQMGNGDSMEQPSYPKLKSERSCRNGKSKNFVSDRPDLDNVGKPDGRTDTKKAKGRKTNSSVQLMDIAVSSRVDNSPMDDATVTSRRKVHDKESDSSQVDDTSLKEVEPAISVDPEMKSDWPDNLTSVASPATSLPNSSQKKRGRRTGSIAAPNISYANSASEQRASSDLKDHSGNGQNDDGSIPLKGDGSEETEDGDDGFPASLMSDSEGKTPSNAGKKGRSKRNVDRESAGRKQKSNNKKQKKEGILRKGVDDDQSLKISETPDRKKEPDEGFVGSKIKVWWPYDDRFYDGVVDSYDPDTKKHKIVYADGDVEILFLEEERYEFVEIDAERVGGKRKVKLSVAQTSPPKRTKASSDAMSNQAKSQTQSKSGTESSSRDIPKPTGRPRSRTSNLGKLSYDDSSETSRKSKRKDASNDRVKTPKSSGKPKDDPNVETPKTSSKQEESGNKFKDERKSKGKDAGNDKAKAPKSSRKLKDDPEEDTPRTGNKREESSIMSKDETSRSIKKSKNEAPKASTKSRDDTSKGATSCSSSSSSSSKVGVDDSKSNDATPKTVNRTEDEEIGKNNTPKTKTKTMSSTPKTGSDSKENGMSSEGKTKGGESENSEAEAMMRVNKCKRKGRK